MTSHQKKRRKFEGKTNGLLSEFSLFRCQIVASVIGNLSLSQACHSWFLCFALCILQKASRKKVDNRFPDVFCHWCVHKLWNWNFQVDSEGFAMSYNSLFCLDRKCMHAKHSTSGRKESHVFVCPNHAKCPCLWFELA
jgi:hypothetical protein